MGIGRSVSAALCSGRFLRTEPRPAQEEDTDEQHEDSKPEVDVDASCLRQFFR